MSGTFLRLVSGAVLVTFCGCKTFDSTEEDLARERKLHSDFIIPRTAVQDSSNPSFFSRPRN